ncbi:MAG TPA: type IV pilus secretin PilQ [Steroidobacteraceae bacterium]|nr:type IV pilus secretin PilQ [Steroidobacteraceae bacterium]
MAGNNRTTVWNMDTARGIVRWLGGALAVLAVAAWSQLAAAQGTARLTAVEVLPMQGSTLQVRLRTDGTAPQPLAFTIDKPARLSVDLPDVGLALDKRRIDVGAGGVDTIVAAEATGRTRVVFNLDSLVPYTVVAEGDSVLVTLGAAAGAANAAAAQAAAGQTPLAASVPSGGRAITGVDFRRSPEGAGRVVVQLSDPTTPASLRQEGNRVIVDFTGVTLGDDLMKRYDVVDFATPVTTFDAARLGNGARLVVTATGDFEQLAYQTDNQYVVEVRQRPRATGAVQDKDKVYTGERLTLNFQDIDVRPVLQLLADTSGQNIVVSDSVKGRVTLRLQNVPWDQALDIVLKTKGLDMRRKGNVILVAPQAELAAQEKAELEAQKDIQELAPLRTEFLTVNYAKASEIARLVKSAGGGSLLSERGNVTVDERTNTLLVQDTAENLTAIRTMVATLDIPVRQVLIESRIVIVADDFSRDLGVRAGFTRVSDDIKDLMAVSGSAQATDTIMGSALDNLASTGQPFPVEVPFGPAFERYNVNMPVANPAGRIALSILDFDDFLIDLELSAAQSEGRGEIKSTPRVITANQREAIIEQGVEIPYQESASSGATTTQFKKAVLSLKVTPQITPDDRVILDLVVTKDSVGQLVPSATGGFVPSIDTRNIQTQVLVKDGQTVVLGGIMETERREAVKKVPGLGDVPVVGNLFKSKNKINNRDELLIFVTPKILREGSTIE